MFKELAGAAFTGAGKFILLAVFIILGIVFMPQDFILKIDQAVQKTKTSVQKEVEKHSPYIISRFSREAVELKAEISEAGQNIKERVNRAAGSKIKEETNKKIDEYFGQ